MKDVIDLENMLNRYDPAAGLTLDLWSGGKRDEDDNDRQPAVSTYANGCGSEILAILLEDKRSSVRYWVKAVEQEVESSKLALSKANGLPYVKSGKQ